MVLTRKRKNYSSDDVNDEHRSRNNVNGLSIRPRVNFINYVETEESIISEKEDIDEDKNEEEEYDEKKCSNIVKLKLPFHRMLNQNNYDKNDVQENSKEKKDTNFDKALNKNGFWNFVSKRPASKLNQNLYKTRSVRQILLEEKKNPSKSSKNKSADSSSEYEYGSDDGFSDDDSESLSSINETSDFITDDSDNSYRRTKKKSRNRRRGGVEKSSRRSKRNSSFDEDGLEYDDDIEEDEIIKELRDLRSPSPHKVNLRQRVSRPDYTIPPPLPTHLPTPKKQNVNGRVTSYKLFSRLGQTSNLHTTTIPSITGDLGVLKDIAESSNSEDELNRVRKFELLGSKSFLSTTCNTDLAGVPSDFGRIKQDLADTDPLGVNQAATFGSIGGLNDFIIQLKEMVSLPLLYPEIFQRFNITPPKGVLFHGPPGTGKTLMARALATSCSNKERKISFFMRKGADCLSKWVGEAERQLRLLFEEAKNSQPSIIFFDEIDGLAPVRSSKQEQIHASIVSTLLALMDGMDSRGQIVVIGATNRPDAVDPALRRPGRFDREFYFSLPDFEARLSIIKIYTKGWDPPLSESFQKQLAEQTKGYGGADLKALCTEAALSAVQRQYPQIYKNSDKLLIDSENIKVEPKDFMSSMKKIIPSSQRSTHLEASSLPDLVVPLLNSKLLEIKEKLSYIMPQNGKVNSLEKAIYEPLEDNSFEYEKFLETFEMSRIFRPRLLIHGKPGMGQQYIGAAVLYHFEGIYVRSFDLASLMEDSTKTPESLIVQYFIEVKRHKPSVIYIPDFQIWYYAVSESVKTTLKMLLTSLKSTEQILFFVVVNDVIGKLDKEALLWLNISEENMVELFAPIKDFRHDFFKKLIDLIKIPPSKIPDDLKKKKKMLKDLPKAPNPPPRVLTKNELKELEYRDRKLKNIVKVKLSPLMEMLKTRYKRFRKPVIDPNEIWYLMTSPKDLSIDITNQPYELVEHNLIHEKATGKKFINMDLELIEEKLWNSIYLSPKQFLHDIKAIMYDANISGDRERLLKAQEMYTNAQMSVEDISDSYFILECRRMIEREKERQKNKILEINKNNILKVENSSNVEKLDENNLVSSVSSMTELSLENTEVNNVITEDDISYDDNIEHMIDFTPIDTIDYKNNENNMNIDFEINKKIDTNTSEKLILKDSDHKFHNLISNISNSLKENPTSINDINKKSSNISQLLQINPDCDSNNEIFNIENIDDTSVFTLILDLSKLNLLLDKMVEMTDSASVEDLEKLYSACINILWQQKNNWNKNDVIDLIEQVFEKTWENIKRPNS
ncbi:hypothetical protein PNEG_02707 [Pneumocystis murina B123]|uniref:AAA+ ATPase domain-containing protein n=1 Tax=Pneumocystis murina (strain B123) TaxID=1069680 RepID=M7NPA7_PNEMU|nr:hypothetical protein PNEG_02707 [Pneumocystis murina B123]EMR08926.1 hypothetical protein PNEG_02707 [Pneumocystis murina B123]